jgi:predicted dehydrogenase
MNTTINWGILGTGFIANKFATALKCVPNAKLLAVGSRTIENSLSFAQAYNVPKAYGSYEELAKDSNIDVVYIATPHVFHCENSLLCLENNKAVLCEKPFAMNEREVLSMVSKAREKKVFLMEAFWTRFLPTILKIDEIIKSGAIGEIVHLKSDFGSNPEYDPNGRFFNPHLGGGSLLDIGIYPVFIALFLLGEPANITSEAVIGKTGIDESLSVTFKYDGNKIANLYSSMVAQTPVETDICGTKGRIRLSRMWFFTNNFTVTMNDGTSEYFEFNFPCNGYEFEAIEVTNCLLNGQTESRMIPLDFSLKLIRLLDKIRKQCGIKYSMD